MADAALCECNAALSVSDVGLLSNKNSKYFVFILYVNYSVDFKPLWF